MMDAIVNKKKLKEVGDNENLYTFIAETRYTFPSREDRKTVKQISSDSLEDVIKAFEAFLSGCGFVLDGQHLELIDNE